MFSCAIIYISFDIQTHHPHRSHVAVHAGPAVSFGIEEEKRMELSIGQKVAYPSQGVCMVEDIEEKTVGDTSIRFYSLRVLSDNSVIFVPLGQCRKRRYPPGYQHFAIQKADNRPGQGLRGNFQRLEDALARIYAQAAVGQRFRSGRRAQKTHLFKPREKTLLPRADPDGKGPLPDRFRGHRRRAGAKRK